MPFNRPTIDQLITRVEGDYKDGLGVVNILRRTFLYVFSRAIAGLAHLLHGFLQWLSLQVFPDTAENEYMVRWASIWGVQRIESTFAELTADIVFTDTGVVPANTLFQRGDGSQYRLDAEVSSVGAGTQQGLVVSENAGSDFNLAVDDIISLISPIANVESDATISAIVTEGEDTETDDSLRARLINRIQLPPLGGSANDYIQWALEVPGVTRAWVLPLYLGAGTVSLSFVEDNDDPIIPDAAKVQEVQDYIDERKPVTALFNAFAPVEAAMDITIKIKPNTSDVQDNVTSELEDLMRRDATLAGSYKGPGETNDGSILLSKINQAISIALGIEDHEIVTINGLAPANVVPNNGELVTLGVITWQAL